MKTIFTYLHLVFLTQTVPAQPPSLTRRPIDVLSCSELLLVLLRSLYKSLGKCTMYNKCSYDTKKGILTEVHLESLLANSPYKTARVLSLYQLCPTLADIYPIASKSSILFNVGTFTKEIWLLTKNIFSSIHVSSHCHGKTSLLVCQVARAT